MGLRAIIAMQGLIGATLERFRSQTAFDQQALAHALGMSPANLCRLERGHGNLTVEQLLSICYILGVEPTAFIGALDDARKEIMAGGDQVIMSRVMMDAWRAKRGYVEIAAAALRDIMEPWVERYARLQPEQGED